MVLSCSVMSDSLQHHGLQPSRLLCPWDSPDKNTGVGCHALLQGIFPTQESNACLPYCRQILYHLSHWGSPRILEWVVYPFSRGTSWPRNWTGISCIAGRFFTSWATLEAPDYMTRKQIIICISLHLLCKSSFCGHYEWSTIKISVRVIKSQYSWAAQWMI